MSADSTKSLRDTIAILFHFEFKKKHDKQVSKSAAASATVLRENLSLPPHGITTS